MEQEVQGRDVRVTEVVHGDQERFPFGELQQGQRQLVVDPHDLWRHECGGRGVRRGGGVQKTAGRGVRTWNAVQELPGDTVGKLLFDGGTPGAQAPEAGPLGAFGDAAQERGPAGADGPLEERDPAAARQALLQQGVELLDLFVSFDQCDHGSDDRSPPPTARQSRAYRTARITVRRRAMGLPVYP
jgi:hypothetical protein